MTRNPKRLEYIHFLITSECENDYGSCFYEGDIPESVLTDLILSRIELKDILKNMSKVELRKMGLQRISKAKQ